MTLLRASYYVLRGTYCTYLFARECNCGLSASQRRTVSQIGQFPSHDRPALGFLVPHGPNANLRSDPAVIAPPRAHPFFRVGAPHRYDNHTSMIIFINPSFLLAYIAYLSKFIKPCNNIISLFNGCTFNWHHRSTHSCLCC